MKSVAERSIQPLAPRAVVTYSHSPDTLCPKTPRGAPRPALATTREPLSGRSWRVAWDTVTSVVANTDPPEGGKSRGEACRDDVAMGVGVAMGD